jgi:hypothetical protein
MADWNHILQLCLEDTVMISLLPLYSSFSSSSLFRIFSSSQILAPKVGKQEHTCRNSHSHQQRPTHNYSSMSRRHRPYPLSACSPLLPLPPQLLRPSVLGAEALSRGTAQRGANLYSLVRILKLCSYRHDFFLFVAFLSTCNFSLKKREVLVCVETRGGVFALLGDGRFSGRDL